MKNKERFYEWLVKMGNIYINDNERMLNAFNKVDYVRE